MKYKAVIFDFDDTLVESREVKWAQHRFVAKKFYNIDLTDEEIKKHWGKPIWELVSNLYKDSDTIENMRLVLARTRDDFVKTVYPESVNIVSKILDEGAEVGILSAATKKYIEEDLIRCGFPLERFISIQGVDESLKHKPDPDVFIPMLDVLSKKGIQKKEILYVGDSMDDFRSANGAGVDFIAITNGLYSEEDFKQAGVEIILEDIKDLLDFI